MIWQLGPQTFFVTCTYVKRLWDLFIKVLHTLHALKLNFLNKIGDLQFVCIPKLIRIDFITCIKYYDHKTFCFCKLIAKDHFLGGFFFFFITEFQDCGSEHDHGLLWIKNAPIYGMHTNEKIE